MVMSMFENSVDELSYTLHAGDHKESDLVVARFEAHEGLSQLFAWQIDVVVDAEAIPTLEDVQGLPAEFRILRHDKAVRIVRGIIGRVTPRGGATKGRQHQVSVTLVPKLAELDYTTNSRIYQNLNVQQIVQDLADRYSVELVWRLERRTEQRAYCVQRDETDLEFFARILADEGIHFSFLHDEDKTSVVLVDAPRGYAAIEGDEHLPYRETGGAVTVDHVGKIERTQALRPGSVALRDYNFQRPGLDLTTRAEVKEPHNAGNRPARETYLYAGGYDKVDPDGTSIAQRRLEQVRSDALVFSGRSSCVRLLVGRTFTLQGHDDDLFNRSLLVTEIALSGQRAGIGETGGKGGPAFVATFFATPSDVRLRPPQRAKPATAPESALVVGPEPGTPFMDDFGRVKVHFFWDRYDQKDEHSSCWLRFMTPAAGADRGIWFPPRVGDEVVVNFFNGDIDRPFVAGALYNADQVHLYPPGQTVTKSTIRSLSIPGGKGHNELTFEDSAGGEEIYLHAQRNLRETILANHSETIGATQTTTVGAVQTITVGAMRAKTVGGDEKTSIGLNRTEDVGQKEFVTIGMGREHTITGMDILDVHTGDRVITVADGQHATYARNNLVKVESKATDIHSSEDIYICGDRIVSLAQGNSTYHMENDAIAMSATEELTITNESQRMHFQKGTVTVEATNELVLKCGTSSISLKKDGTIAISGATSIALTCSTSNVTIDKTSGKLEANNATLSAKATCIVSGGIVKIN